ncbi:MAG TPA: TonB family protein [Longimicrobium sp.]|jgi:protein TonB|nr:TonB family protein [Longimicrobium sp.]
MFNKLVASEGRRKTGFWSPQNIVISLVLHGVLIAGLVTAGVSAENRRRSNEELVDFVEVEEEKPKEPEPEKPKEPEPPPPEPEPETPPPVVKGFQTIVPPEEPPPTIAPPSANEQAVNEADFSGQGAEGGASNGVEGGVAQSTVQRETPPDEGTYEMSAVEELPRPRNTADLARALQRNYPPLLRDAGVTGTVQVRMRVMEDGSVDASSISVTSSTHEQFNDPSIRSVQRLRFSPAKVNGRPVKVWVELPIQWTVARS